MKNFYGEKEYAKVQRKLTRELNRLRKQFDVPEKDPAASFETGDTPQRYQQRGKK